MSTQQTVLMLHSRKEPVLHTIWGVEIGYISQLYELKTLDIQNAELLTPATQNWHNFFRSYGEMAENRRKQQKSMSLSLTSETAVEYTI